MLEDFGSLRRENLLISDEMMNRQGGISGVSEPMISQRRVKLIQEEDVLGTVSPGPFGRGGNMVKGAAELEDRRDLVGDLKKPSDHSLDSGFIPGSRPPWRSLCLVKRTLSTLLRFLLDHQEAPNRISTASLSQTRTIFPLTDSPTRMLDDSPGNFYLLEHFIYCKYIS
ncbi:hypothetical protein AMECASPLE_029218 [Ameca splendens]|uniref:Uncharacterized protein n=1 Tax=Ameca splendens TaxID=208324 RepID=A0ABV0YSR9_9TELE